MRGDEVKFTWLCLGKIQHQSHGTAAHKIEH